VRVAVTVDGAQRIADVLGVLLPTDRIADMAHAQADVRLMPHWQAPVTATTDAMLRHHADIEAERAGRDGLLSTIGKDWILGCEIFPVGASSRPAHPLGFMSSDNAHVEQVAMLTKSATLALQLNRLSIEAQGTRRAVFLGAKELLAWLEPHILLIERQRAAVFLGSSG